MQLIHQSTFFDAIEEQPKVQPAPVLTKELIDDFVTSGKTSIYRSGLSAPMKVVIEKQLLQKGSSLNYGKGRHNFDSDGIEAVTSSCQNYDYVYHPDIEVLGHYYVNVFSSYVVNTLRKESRNYVWHQMASCTHPDKGVCFVAARTDKSNIVGQPLEDGYLTKIKTFQKAYSKNELVLDARNYFAYAIEIKSKSGFSLVACSHAPLPENILMHAKR